MIMLSNSFTKTIFIEIADGTGEHKVLERHYRSQAQVTALPVNDCGSKLENVHMGYLNTDAEKGPLCKAAQRFLQGWGSEYELSHPEEEPSKW